MSTTPRPRRSRLRRVAFPLFLALTLVGVYLAVREWNRPPRPTLDGLTLVPARRTDLRSTLRTGGRTRSKESTTIECQLERLEMRSEGRSTMTGGASTILWVIDEGSWVKKDDLLCSLDSSEYVELVRQQEIKVDRARADLQQAKLTYESSQLAVREFRDGLVAQTRQDYEGKLKLAQADRQRAEDRLNWSSRMLEKGYVSGDQVSTDRQSLRRAELAITKAKWALANFLEFGVPMETRSLESEVATAKAQLASAEARFTRFVERLEYYQLMVKNCTITAPHDGYVIYATPPSRYGTAPRIEAGVVVRQMQDLFVLPDLSKMEVIAPLHESIVNKVHPGMTERAKIEGLANRELEGHVVKVDPLPDTSENWLSDVKYFNATIRLDHPPGDIRPTMTAEVEIDLGRRNHVIAIPSEALAYESGHDVCYVATGDDTIERRPVKIGQSNRDLLEVTDGIDEGEHIVVDLSRIASYSTLIVDAPPHHPAPPMPVVAAPTADPSAAEKAGS